MSAVSALASNAGAWIPIGHGLEVVVFEYDLSIGAGNITGTITVEHTPQLNGTPSSASRVMLPLGSLHTSLSGASLASAPNPSSQVTLTAITAGKLAVMLGKVPPGQIRSSFVFGSGSGASPNTITTYCTGWGLAG